MAIIRWRPWNMQSLLDEDWDFPTIPGLTKLGQGLNLYETEEEVVAQAALPGVAEDKVDVTIDEGVVRITGSSEDTQEEKNDRRYFMTSMAQAFNYSFRLPEGLVQTEPEAEIQNGVLTLKFRKAQKTPPKRVKVVSKGKTEKK